MSDTSRPAVLSELAAAPRDQLSRAIDGYDHGDVVEALAQNLAARMDRKAMVKAGVAVEVLCHTSTDAVSRFITWDKGGPVVAASYEGAGAPVRMEWQRLSDAVDYELGRITLQGVGLVQRFGMVGSRADLQTVLAAEEVPDQPGRIIRGLKAVSEMSDRQREKALRGVDIDALLVEQQQATNEALRIFNLLPELSGRVIEWRVGDGSNVHVVQSIYEGGDYEVALGEKVERHALLHFLRLADFAQFLNGKTTVPAIAMEGHLKVDGDFHLLEILGRIPEPFDPVERWAND